MSLVADLLAPQLVSRCRTALRYFPIIPDAANSLWTIANVFVKISLSNILVSDVFSGHQTQGGYIMQYKSAMSASFAMAISPVSSMLYRPEIVHQMTQPNWILIIQTTFSHYNPGDRITSAGV
jgi:hypothetical protein